LSCGLDLRSHTILSFCAKLVFRRNPLKRSLKQKVWDEKAEGSLVRGSWFLVRPSINSPLSNVNPSLPNVNPLFQFQALTHHFSGGKRAVMIIFQPTKLWSRLKNILKESEIKFKISRDEEIR